MIVGRVASSVARRQIRYVHPVPPATATGAVAAVYRQVADEMRLVIPPASMHSPSPEALVGYWMLMREPLLPAGVAGRTLKEAVAAAVSVANICPYCVDMHSAGLYDLVGEDQAEAIATDNPQRLTDPLLREFVDWAATAHTPRGVLPGGVSAVLRAELVGVVVAMHYLSRMVNVFLAPFLVPPGLGPRGRRRFKRGMGLVLRPTLRDPRPAGRSLTLAPSAPLPLEAAWAAGSSAVAEAAARSYALFEELGERSLSPVVRALVQSWLLDWNGDDMGLSRQWCEGAVAALGPADRAAARLTLLTALSSYQVDEDVVGDFRSHFAGDRSLIEATAWASFAAARRIGTRHFGVTRS